MLKAWSYLCHMIGGQGVPPFPGLEGKGNVLGLTALSVSQAHTQNTWYIFFSKFEQPKRNSFPPLYSVGNQGEFGIFPELCLHFCLGSHPGSAHTRCVTLGRLCSSLGLSLPTVT